MDINFYNRFEDLKRVVECLAATMVERGEEVDQMMVDVAEEFEAVKARLAKIEAALEAKTGTVEAPK